jgi:predicted transcriptional regulator
MHMRTTVDIDDGLLERAKRLALKEKRTLAAVVGQALAAYLSSRRAAAVDPPFELLVRGKVGARFPTAEEVLLADEDDDRKALAIPSVKRRAAP